MRLLALAHRLRILALALPLFALATTVQVGCGVVTSDDVGSGTQDQTAKKKNAYGGYDYGGDYGDYGYGDWDYGGYGGYGP